MKFAKKYPLMTPNDPEIDGIVKGERESPCVTCVELTQFMEICFEVCVCSEECLNKFIHSIYGRSNHDEP